MIGASVSSAPIAVRENHALNVAETVQFVLGGFLLEDYQSKKRQRNETRWLLRLIS